MHTDEDPHQFPRFRFCLCRTLFRTLSILGPAMKTLAFSALLILCIGAPAKSQSLADGLAAFAFPLSLEAAESDELDPLLDAVSDARIIGLGEPTHGTAEVFRLKQRVIQRLVEEGGVRHLVLEASVGEGADFDDYIAGRRDDLDALRRGIPLWMFQVDEFANLLRWLRSFNETAKQPVRVHGMEAQYADRSARDALAYLRQHDAALAGRLLEDFGQERVAGEARSAELFASLYQPMSDETYNAYQTLFLGLRSAYDSRRAAFIAATGESAFLEARQHVSALGQFLSLALLENAGAKAQLRDYVMAINVAAIAQRVPQAERVVVWAHNEHVWKREGNGGYDVLGRQLARWYGPSYYAIGFDFGSGSYRAPSSGSWIHEVGPPDRSSFTAALAGAGNPDLFLDIRGALATPAGAKALSGGVNVRATAGGFVPMRNGVLVEDQTITLADRFDGLLFVASSTPSSMPARDVK